MTKKTNLLFSSVACSVLGWIVLISLTAHSQTLAAKDRIGNIERHSSAILLSEFPLTFGGFTTFGSPWTNSKRLVAFPGTLNPQVFGAGTLGRLTKWTGSSFIGDSNIFESKFGLVGIGTDAPTSPLTVQGMIETTMGGYKFPDGSIQTSAGLSSILHDATLSGSGSSGSPLAIAVPLSLEGSDSFALVQVINHTGSAMRVQAGAGLSLGGTAITAFGGDNPHTGGTGIQGVGGSGSDSGGIGVIAQGHDGGSGGEGLRAIGGSSFVLGGSGGLAIEARGGDSSNGTPGDAMSALGGTSVLGFGGVGLRSVGGNSSDEVGGVGVRAEGGISASRFGGAGIQTFGGLGSGSGNRGGSGLFAQGGRGQLGADQGLAAEFNGTVEVNGFLTKSSGSFKIDHPIDPANKFLYHSFVESPDMKNIYDGVVTLDSRGEATVDLPSWFGALNKDFRYQLTALGVPSPGLYVAQEVADNRFRIAGGSPSARVSWQVTGIRQDVYANAHRIQVEEDKPKAERGYYLHPELFNLPEERGIEWIRHQDPSCNAKSDAKCTASSNPLEKSIANTKH